jgi:hypothetical protein
VSDSERFVTLWTWQDPDWDIRCEGWDPSNVDRAWEDLAPRVRSLYRWLHGLLGTSDFVWCFWEYEHWSAEEIRKLWKLQVPRGEVLALVDKLAWDALVNEDYTKMDEASARRRLLRCPEQRNATPLVAVPLARERAEDCGRYNLGLDSGLRVPFADLATSTQEAGQRRREHAVEWGSQ